LYSFHFAGWLETDDGPDLYEKELATTLKKAKATGTFFVNGNNWVSPYFSLERIPFSHDPLQACIYDAADQIIAAYNDGQQIA
jgi:peptidoglycan/xylan/chitin deacetylase (PgdA/CDA1 family)